MIPNWGTKWRVSRLSGLHGRGVHYTYAQILLPQDLDLSTGKCVPLPSVENYCHVHCWGEAGCIYWPYWGRKKFSNSVIQCRDGKENNRTTATVTLPYQLLSIGHACWQSCIEKDRGLFRLRRKRAVVDWWYLPWAAARRLADLYHAFALLEIRISQRYLVSFFTQNLWFFLMLVGFCLGDGSLRLEINL